MKHTFKPFYGLAIAILASVQSIECYESLFIVGSEVLWQNGLKYQLNTEVKRAGQFTEITLDNIWTYGITRDFSIMLDLPIIMTTEQFTLTPAYLPSPVGTIPPITPGPDALIANILSRNRAAGVGDIEILGKYRVLQNVYPGKELELTLISGFKIPTGSLHRNKPKNSLCNNNAFPCILKQDACKSLPTGTGTFDLLEYIAFSYNSHSYLFFSTIGCAFRTGRSSKIGHEFTWSLAGGPRLMEAQAFTMPDFILMPELDVIHTFGKKDCYQPDTLGTTIWLGPTVFYSQAFLITKFGIQWPLTQHHCNRKLQDYRLAGGFDFYF